MITTVLYQYQSLTIALQQLCTAPTPSEHGSKITTTQSRN